MHQPARIAILTAAFALFTLGSAARAGEGAAPAPAAGKAVLDANSFWHAWLGWKSVQVQAADGTLATLADGKEKKPRPLSASLPPPAGWTKADFDDADWTRTQGPFAIGAWCQSYVDTIGPGNPGEVAMICLRGRFRCDDPAAVKELQLRLIYSGGVAVFLNGKEVARSHLPPADKAPELKFGETLAERYPDDCYTRPDGSLLTEREGKEFPERFKARTREFTAAIPAEGLVKGTNVLAVAVLRAPFAEVYVTAKRNPQPWPGPATPWPHARLDDVRLTAAPGAPLEAANSRPKGVQVWNRSVLEALDGTDFGDPCDRLAAVRISGARNGAFSGQVMVGSDAPLAGLKAKMGELRSADGKNTIAAERCRVRYALADAQTYWYNPPPTWFDSLVDAAPDPVPVKDKRCGAVCPVWVTVNVPADAAPGVYSGKLLVSAAGLAETPVEVRLEVAPFVLPAPRDFLPHLGLIQSPDSVAMQYNVEMWSEKHWAHLEKTFELLGQAGNKTVFIPLLRQTHFGNQHTMVRWIKGADPSTGSGPGGGYKYDFTVLDKYLDLAAKHLGKPPVVCLLVWDLFCGSQYLGTKDIKAPGTGYLFTELDPKTGQLTEAEGPKWDSPEIVDFVKAVVDATREHLAKRGLEGSMMIGMSGDSRPTKEVTEVLKKAAPGVKWVSQAHPRLPDLFGLPAGYVTNVWVSGAPVDPGIKRSYWKPKAWIDGTFPREGHKCIYPLRHNTSPVVPRMIIEATVAAGMDGVGRVGADFWEVLPGKHPGERYAINGRYPASGWAQLGIQHATTYVLGAGPEGPVSTVRFELLREGLQATEARMQLERALGDPAARGKLGEDLAARCDALLDARTYSIMRAGASGMAGGARRNPYWWGFVSSGWQGRDAALYALAAEAAGKLGTKM
ncbi:MAG TPA: hypothetical protein PK280_15960 [Planctomycetota bacterium]|nr:hypothetical protein [Planctomycetota bacterium]